MSHIPTVEEHPQGAQNIRQLAEWIVGLEGKTAASESETETSYHLTDDPKFALDPDKNPANNTTWGGDWPHKGLFVTDSPERWLNGYDYVRPFVAEIEHPKLKDIGGYGGERFLPAEHFPKSKVKRVIPLDEHAREEYHDYGWIESFHGTDSKGDKLPEAGEWGNRSRSDLEDYHYTGPDVRDMPKDEIKKHFDRMNDYIKTIRPHLLGDDRDSPFYDTSKYARRLYDALRGLDPERAHAVAREVHDAGPLRGWIDWDDPDPLTGDDVADLLAAAVEQHELDDIDDPHRRQADESIAWEALRRHARSGGSGPP